MSGFGHICYRIEIQDQTFKLTKIHKIAVQIFTIYSNKLKVRFNLSQFSDASPVNRLCLIH